MNISPALCRAAARHARGALELLLQLREWAPDPALSRAIDRLVELEEEPRGDDEFLDAVEAAFGEEIVRVVRQLRDDRRGA